MLAAILRNDATAAGERMAHHVSLLSEGIADFLHFVRSSDHAGLFRMRPDMHLDFLPTGPSVRSSRAR